ncbi:Spo0E family sporulation regulatory protein-aspartic acid phosphatase [Bacillus songklensis]|uniref:Spo0E family sporulation regulatory protein-aspartic acid phosphatase n=1 Tax=Bacillus songklensis TaxID=1069116 RepID=A0ABV8B0L4_9BACI
MLNLYKFKSESKSQQLLNHINEMKRILIDHALTYGLSNPSTVKLSQELDKLLNEIQTDSR